MAVESDCIAPGLVAHASRIVRLLAERRLTVVTAESCTAGLIAAALAQGEGASDVLHGGFVTYTKEQKSAALGVAPELLAREGSVNAAVAEALAAGALERSPADIALAVTGVLGPEPDEDGSPVGLVYFCCARRGQPAEATRHRYEKDDPDVLRRKVVLEALDLIERAARSRGEIAATLGQK